MDTIATTEQAEWRDYLRLLKPRVMSLVVFTAATGLVAARAPINPGLAAIAVLCIAIGAGGSAAFNMGFDSDIDAVMRRTRHRPVPAGLVARPEALALGGVLSLFSVGLLGLATNWLAAGLLAFTIFFYAVVYTLWLKRRTAQNIVIGGLSGALPPLVGWAAATGTAPLNAWLLVAIIFMWTPPHFWALSLYTTEDYAAAGVPMMPVVRGAASTRRQIFGYSLLLAPLGVAPALTGLGGALYLFTAIGGGIAMAAGSAQLLMVGDRDETQKAARRLFLISLIYLFALFLALLVEALVGLRPLPAMIPL
jgi:heme o synthase